MKIPESKLSRRKFLLALGTGSAAATAALVANRTPEVQPQPGKQVKNADSQGYRLTEHIQNYYRTAKV